MGDVTRTDDDTLTWGQYLGRLTQIAFYSTGVALRRHLVARLLAAAAIMSVLAAAPVASDMRPFIDGAVLVVFLYMALDVIVTGVRAWWRRRKAKKQARQNRRTR